MKPNKTFKLVKLRDVHSDFSHIGRRSNQRKNCFRATIEKFLCVLIFKHFIY